LAHRPAEGKSGEHFARRHTIVEERSGQIETIGIVCAFEPRQARESQMDMR
jgi:hypothetical protein